MIDCREPEVACPELCTIRGQVEASKGSLLLARVSAAYTPEFGTALSRLVFRALKGRPQRNHSNDLAGSRLCWEGAAVGGAPLRGLFVQAS